MTLLERKRPPTTGIVGGRKNAKGAQPNCRKNLPSVPPLRKSNLVNPSPSRPQLTPAEAWAKLTKPLDEGEAWRRLFRD
jgi:hypothetical protein